MSDAQALLPLDDFVVAALPTEADDLRDMAILDGVPAHLFVLMLDQARPDIVAQRDAIKHLLADGYTEREIAAVTPFNHSAIQRRLHLDNALPALVELYRAGGATAAVLEGCSKLPEYVQRELAEKASVSGKLTSKDVSEARRTRADAALNSLPGGLFAPEPAPPAAEWRSEARAHLERVIALVPEVEAYLAERIRELIEELEAAKT